MRRLLMGAVFVAILILTTSPALAKGPEGATITGPGIDEPILIKGNGEPSSGTAFGQFVAASGFWQLVFAADGDGRDPSLLPAAPTDELGEPYTIVWHLADARVESIAYPHAAGGSLTYIEPGVVVSGFDRTTEGGWFRTPEPLAPMLDRYGVTMSAQPVDATATTTPPPTTTARVVQTAEGVAPPASVPAVAAADSVVPRVLVAGPALAALGTGIWATRRRLRRVSAP